jgi:hypothetical protein
MIPISSMLLAIAILLLTLGMATRFLATGNLSVGWISVPRILRAVLRTLVRMVGGSWRASQMLVRRANGRRNVRRLPSRASIGGARRPR